MILASLRFTKEKRVPVTPLAAIFYLMHLFATGFGGGYSGKWFVEGSGSGSGGGGRSGGWLIGGGGFWSSGAAPTNAGIALAVTAMAGLALAATIIYSRRGGLKSPWSRRRRKHSLLPKQWISLFLPDGKLCDGGVKFLKKVRSGGVDPSIRVEVWPFLLGVYDLNSSQEERDAVKKQNRKQYEILRKQCKQITRRNEKGPGSKENTGYSSEFSGEISHGGCSSELSGEIIHGGGYNSEFSGEISQVLDPIVEDSLPENPKEDAVRSVSNERESSVSQKPKEESLSSNGSLSSEKEGSVSDNPIEEPAVDLDGSLSNGRDDSGSDRTQTFQREGSVSQNLMEGTPKIKDRVEPVDSREPLSKEIVEGGVSENLVEESRPSYVTKNIDCGGTDKPGQSSPTEVEVEGEGSLDKSEVTSDSTISESSDSDELEYLPPLFSSSELEGADADGNPSELKTTTKKSHTNEDFTTWQRIIRLDAVRANDEWIIYSPSQANVTQMKARRLARSVGLKDFDHLDACRVFHAARLVAILEAYAIYDPEIGYCQGMSDLLSPLVTVIEDDDMAFWCFVGFMKKARHNFRLDEVGIRSQLNLVSKIIKCKDSHLYSHLEKLQAEDCFFVYRMVVVLFRRELDFDQTLCLWEVIWADQAAIRAGIARSAWRRMRLRAPPTDDLLLFAIAACVLQRRKLIIEKYSSMEEIMRECNSMAGQLDVWKLVDDAHDLVVNLHEKIYKQTT